MTRSGVSIAVLAAAAGLAGCSPGVPFDDPFAEYTQRSLTISPTAAIRRRRIWRCRPADRGRDPPSTRSIPGNGPLMVKAVQNYESGSGGAAAPASGGGAAGAGAAGGAPTSPAPPPPAN